MSTPVYPYLKTSKLTSELPKPVQGILTENQLDALDWARRFMRDYEKKHKRKTMAEELQEYWDYLNR